jgi:hypothetical protein
MGELTGSCECGCGQLTSIAAQKAAGYLKGQRKRFARGHNSVHKGSGLSRHPLYGTWSNMMDRCENTTSRDYPNWGGRGIRVCGRWRDVRAFIEDIERDLGPKPTGWTLDRIDNNGHYEPGNVRWASPKMQGGNRRPRSDAERVRQSELARRQWQERRAAPRTEVCEWCGQEYETCAVPGSKYQRFCTPRCRSLHRYASGVDNEERTCHQCGGTFVANRHNSTRHCSRSCATKCRYAGSCPH